MKYLIHDKIRLGVAVLLCFCTALQTDAKVKLPALISDGMVLQREQPVKVWGTADAGERVSVTFMKKKYAATADNNGHWNVTNANQRHQTERYIDRRRMALFRAVEYGTACQPGDRYVRHRD